MKMVRLWHWRQKVWQSLNFLKTVPEQGEQLMEKLRAWGCDVEGALERFIGDEEFYISCLKMTTEDLGFEELGEALREGDAEKAFDSAHTLKGVLANVGLTPMFEVIVRIVEPLRAGQMENLMPIYEELLQANQYLKGLLEEME